jgi:hypothetical protein
MKQSDTSQSGRGRRERGSYSYKVKNGDLDLKEQIRELGALEDSLYSGRSEADIAGMILLKFVPKEIEKHKQRG